MELIKTILAWAFLIALVGGCLITLWAIIRFSIISSIRTRGERGRLRHPELDKVNARWDVELPSCLGDFYRTNEAVTKNEFFFVQVGTDRKPRGWYISSFIPLTVKDIGEWLKVFGRLEGIPIALDSDKGVYFIPTRKPDGRGTYPVLRGRPRRKGHEITEVAGTIEEFVAFVPLEDEDENVEPGTAPNGGPAMPVGNSGATEGPPSVN